MKELSIVKQMVADGQISQEVAEKYFPELKESEDERIRKSLLEHFITFNQEDNYLDGVPFSHVVAWLEKQKSINETDEEISAAMRGVGTLELVNGIAHCTNKKGVIPPKEESGVLGAMIDKQNPVEWSEEDERYINIVVSALSSPSLERLYHFNKVKSNDIINWCESLKDRVLPQLKQEWSEEDKKMRNRAIFACNFTMDRTHSEGHYQYQETIDWLKALPIGFIKNPNYNEDMVELLIGELRQIANENKASKQYDKEIEWLKSLRPQKQ